MTIYLYINDDGEIKLFSDYSEYLVINDSLFMYAGKTELKLEK